MIEDTDIRALRLGEYIASTSSTVRAAASRYGVSKSTVHKDVTERLRTLDGELFLQVEKVLQKNKAERHIRGGNSTKLKYKKICSETEASVDA